MTRYKALVANVTRNLLWERILLLFSVTRNQNICMKVHCVYKVVAKPSPDLFPAMLSSYASPQALSLIGRKVRSGN
jgi:hypothetical protein